MRRVVFLDRDGTIMRDVPYLADPAKVELLPGAVHGLRHMMRLGYELFLVTNQSGVARGLLTEGDVRAVNAELLRQLSEQGVEIRDVRYCPHLQAGKVERYAYACNCRKPQPGMLVDLALTYGLDLSQSVMVGDKCSDVEAGLNAGASAVLLGTARQAANDLLADVWKKERSQGRLAMLPDLMAVGLWLQERQAQTATTTPTTRA
ncbi:MAG TPA: HAD family hydrolase [Bacilli bacterium]|nr:HAD family hydrolase [Bacilli bacterium]